MTKELFVRALITWFLFIPIAIINGIIRNSVYLPYVGELTAHQISTVTASLAIVLVSYFMLGSKVEKVSNSRLLFLGLGWVVATILFEFGFGHYIMGNSWEKLLADYNLLQGRVWALFLLVVFITPLTVKKLRSKKNNSSLL